MLDLKFTLTCIIAGMDTHAHFFRHLPLDMFSQPQPNDAWEQSPLAKASDTVLVEAVAAAIAPPKAVATSSFILHAPLELLARALLLPYVAPVLRAAARRRIAEIAARYTQAGEDVPPPKEKFTDVGIATAALKEALRNGDADVADDAAACLSRQASVAQIRAALIDDLVPTLGAAAHAPILLAQISAFDNRVHDLRALIRAPIRAVAKGHASPVTWHLTLPPARTIERAEDALFNILASPPRLTSPSTSIAPTVLAVEKSGDAARLLAPFANTLSVTETSRVLLRVAAWSMIQDDPKNAPYGWTHCLTLPQALLQNADVARDHRALIAVAATEVLAFRATEGNTDIDTTQPLASEAHAAYSVTRESQPALVESLASFAATHPDAHVAKYTLACLQAAANDREAAPLFFAAAAHLHAWWRDHDKAKSLRAGS
jgi:hypothetical protein